MKKVPEHYVNKCRKIGEQMAGKDGSGMVIFTDHAIERCYHRRIAPWKALMVVDNPDRQLDDQNIDGKIYNRFVKEIGHREVYISLIKEPKIINNNEVEIIVLTSVAWRARDRKKK